MNGITAFCYSAIFLTAFVAGDNFSLNQRRSSNPNFKWYPPLPSLPSLPPLRTSTHGFGSSSSSRSSSRFTNGHPETITNTQVTGSATANADASVQINQGFGVNSAFQNDQILGTTVNNGHSDDTVETKNQDSSQNKEEADQPSGFQTDNKGHDKDQIDLPENGGYGRGCNCICTGIKPFKTTGTNNQSNADFNSGINFETRFGSSGIHKSGTFQKGPSRGISSSSSAQSFPDGSGSFEVSATKIN